MVYHMDRNGNACLFTPSPWCIDNLILCTNSKNVCGNLMSQSPVRVKIVKMSFEIHIIILCECQPYNLL